MLCSGLGDEPTAKENCTNYCDVKIGPDECAFDPCACTLAGKFCGTSLPLSCGYVSSNIYTCEGNGTIPAPTPDCPAPQVCLETATGPVCTPQECICQDDSLHCGSTLDTRCNLANNTLYKCSTGLLPSVQKDCSPGVCSANIVANAASFLATADDSCVNQCACKVPGVAVRTTISCAGSSQSHSTATRSKKTATDTTLILGLCINLRSRLSLQQQILDELWCTWRRSR